MALAPFIPKWVQTASAHSELIGMEGFQRADFSVEMVSRGLPMVVVDFDGAIAPGTSEARQKELIHALLAVIDKYGLEEMDDPVLHLPNGTALTVDLDRFSRGSDADLDSALDIVLRASAPQAYLGTSKQVSLSLADRMAKAQCHEPDVVPARFTELESRIIRIDTVPVDSSVFGISVDDCPEVEAARTVSEEELAAVAALPQWHRENQARIITYHTHFDARRPLQISVTVPQLDATIPETLIARLAEAGMTVTLQSQSSYGNGQHEYFLVASA